MVNYSDIAAGLPTLSITDSDGNRWGIDNLGLLSTFDNTALQSVEIPSVIPNYTESLSVTTDDETGSVTVATGSTVTYSYTPLAEQARAVVSWFFGGRTWPASAGLPSSPQGPTRPNWYHRPIRPCSAVWPAAS